MKQVKKNRPGQGARPTPGGTPVRDRAARRPYIPAQPVAQPTVAPSYAPPQAEPDPAAQTDYTAGMLDESDRARADLTAGYASAEQASSLQSPTKLTAAQMRQAIVWAEILKRPSERWQSGRWSAR